jgi:protein SCO1/2
MKARSPARLVALTLACMLCEPAAVRAAQQHIHGVILTVLGPGHNVAVRQDATAGMPAMTMLYGVSPAVDLKRLHPGEQVDAWLDGGKPERIVRVSVVAAPPAVQELPVPILATGQAVPATSFVDQHGGPFSFAALRGRTVILAFIYTRCKDGRMCPLISAKFHQLQGQLRGGPFHLVEVTLDPSYDRPKILAAYGRQFDADPSMWTLATGDPDRVLDFDAHFGIVPFADEHTGIIHSEQTVVIDPAGRIRATIEEAGWSTGEIVAAARAAANLSSNPLERFDLWLSEKAMALCGNQALGFSGLLDLTIVLAILSVSSWVLYRVARHIFAESA